MPIRSDFQHLVANRERRSDSLRDSRGHQIRTGGIGGGQDESELIATKSGDRVRFTQGTAQPLSHGFQQFVTGMVAIRVIHLFEPVQIHEKDAKETAFSLCTCHGFLQSLQEVSAIWKIGERVMERTVREDLLFCLRVVTSRTIVVTIG
jgi:hypothetical protein